MIAEFLDSWSLFGPAYLTAIAGAVLLSLVGVFVVARDQVFLAAAVSHPGYRFVHGDCDADNWGDWSVGEAIPSVCRPRARRPGWARRIVERDALGRILTKSSGAQKRQASLS